MGAVDGNDCVGGLVAKSDTGRILSGCSAAGDVTGHHVVGGLIGDLDDATLTQCYATGQVAGSDNVGGLIGTADDTTCMNCYATGDVTGHGNVGGLAGYSAAQLTNCYALGNVGGVTSVGGLAGYQSPGRRSRTATVAIRGCYSIGEVTGESDVGGLVGSCLSSVTAAASFWDVDRSGQISSPTGQGLTTAALQELEAFRAAGWDFLGLQDGPSDIWALDPVGGYPILWWQVPDAPLSAFAGGTGTPEDPYLIASAEQLNSIGHNPRLMAACFMLSEDIDLAGVNFFSIGNIMFHFSGTFDGDGRTIANFSCAAPDGDYVGLFNYVDGAGARIQDLGLIDPNVDAPTVDGVGALVGRMDEGTIARCYVSGGSVAGNNYVGGLVGTNLDGVIAYCFADCAVSGREYSEMESPRSNPGGDFVGGLVGHSGGLVGGCHATSAVVGNREVGGLIGNNYGVVRECHAAGPTAGSDRVGGLVGYDHHDGLWTIASFWDVETSGLTESDGGTGLTTAEMMTAAPFCRGGVGFCGTGRERDGGSLVDR